MKIKLGSFTFATVLAVNTTWGQPAIVNQPQSMTNLAGTTAVFSVTATGTPPLAYQWCFNSSIVLANATNADLTLTNAQSVNRLSNGPYWPEYLSTNLGLAFIEANNYAQCGAGAADVLNQTRSYPALHPAPRAGEDRSIQAAAGRWREPRRWCVSTSL